MCKSILAFEITQLAHGRDAALSALEAAGSIFGRRSLPPDLIPSSSIPREAKEKADSVPTTRVPLDRLEAGIPAFELFAETGLCDTRSAAQAIDPAGRRVCQ